MSRPGGTYVNPNKLFKDDDDVDNGTSAISFRTRIPPPQPSKPAPSAHGSHIAALEQQRQAMLERPREIEKRTLDSSTRSIGLLRDSEQIGIAIAREFNRQGEQLQNTNKRLDEINTNLNCSQKHSNGIKSVFYGLKNNIFGKPDQTPPRRKPSPSKQSAGPSRQLNDTIDNLTQVNCDDRFRSHPATRLRELNEQVQAAPMSDSQRINQLLDANLDEILHSVSRLQGLATALGDEIVQQNELIDTIATKVDGADIKMGKQNKMMNKLLRK